LSSPCLGVRGLEPTEEELEELLRPLLKKKGLIRKKPVEEPVFKGLLYMPYDIVEFKYRLASGEEGTGKTAINLVLASSTDDPRELTLCLRPDYVGEATRASELSEGIRAIRPRVRGLDVLRKLAEVRAEVEGFRSKAGAALADARRKMTLPQYRILSLFIPVPSIQAMMAERAYSDLYARVEGFVREFNVRLGLDEGAELEALDPCGQDGPIYFPSFLIGLSGPDGDRLIVLDLSGQGPNLDVEATYLCLKRPELRDELVKALVGQVQQAKAI